MTTKTPTVIDYVRASGVDCAPIDSETTVKSHLRNIVAKSNVLSRTKAISVASRLGLIRLQYPSKEGGQRRPSGGWKIRRYGQ